ncbi:BtrH N-terminal domain-containing protein [Lentimicrobium sp. S6]|uniref:BtrH N-terminal domain-containing protein n=1 Tax=Lentimicrobium sp. S6 TaxID=2735872 RepID=UPI0015518A3E|nr:BtrH N-terminal domain-containing protein [Lentimicrobium sp. S6]NPD45297.1 BtrH N-terminal domain-containing protein [Lentimicrobium sp. S6]
MAIDFKHEQSAHCENGVASNLLHFYGIKLSEPMIFGIGSGLFFSHMPFVKVNNIPVTSFRPLPGVIFRRAARRLGFSVKRKKFRSPDKGMAALDGLLQKDIPVGMLVGVYHLSYFPAPYRFHFNAHNLVVFGKENGNYKISDPVMDDYASLTEAELKKVRFAKGLFAPKGHMYWADKIPTNPDFKKAIIKGIHHTAKDMLGIPVPMFGVKGIRFMAKKVRNYPTKLGKRKASQFLGQIVRAQEEIGTGGAGFRFMYAAFLQEAAEILELDWLNDTAEEMTQIGDLWRSFAVATSRIVKDRSQVEDAYNQAADILLVIADREEQVYKDLKKIKK